MGVGLMFPKRTAQKGESSCSQSVTASNVSWTTKCRQDARKSRNITKHLKSEMLLKLWYQKSHRLFPDWKWTSTTLYHRPVFTGRLWESQLRQNVPWLGSWVWDAAFGFRTNKKTDKQQPKPGRRSLQWTEDVRATHRSDGGGASQEERPVHLNTFFAF